MKKVDTRAFIPEPTVITLRDGSEVRLFEPVDIPYTSFIRLNELGQKLTDMQQADAVENMAEQITLVIPELTIERVREVMTMRDMMEIMRVMNGGSEGNAQAASTTESQSITPPSSLQ